MVGVGYVGGTAKLARVRLLIKTTAPIVTARAHCKHQHVTSVDYPDLVEQVKENVEAEGTWERHRHCKVCYWLHNGYRYWVMPGLGTLKVLILNRAKLKPKYHEVL